ncbi:LOW QUALITY PROTEIN: BYE1 Transcription factor BYE1 [Candida maltosa Xu316]
MAEERRRFTRTNRGTNMKRYLDDELDTEDSKKQKLDVIDLSDEGYEEDANSDSDVQEIENIEDEEDGEVRCIPCGANTENYEDFEYIGNMVQCERCKTWQHSKCMGYRTKRDIPEVHHCDVCTGVPTKPIKTRAKPKKKSTEPEQKSPVTGVAASLKDEIRVSTAKAFYNFFKKCLQNRTTLKEGPIYDFLSNLTDEEKEEKANSLSLEIENLIYEQFKGASYTSEGRRILFVLKKHFMDEILLGTIKFVDVIHKTPQEINAEIAEVERQNRENIKNIILTQNDDNSQIIRRTHKGDIIKENEFEHVSSIDESIATRKVDHRKFSEDINVISHTDKESKVYNNLNPRFEEEEEDHHNNNNHTAVDDEKVSENKDASRSTESLSDLDTTHHGNNAEDEDDDDELLSFLSGGEDSYELPDMPKVWEGRFTFPDFATFNAIGELYSFTNESERGSERGVEVAKEILIKPEYTIQGKLNRQTADDYLSKVVKSRDLYILEISNARNVNDEQYLRLYKYLLHKSKVGVLSVKLKFVKDSYLIPIDFRDEQLPAFWQSYKKDLRIGLFAVFVVQKNYIPGLSKDEVYRPEVTYNQNHRYHTPQYGSDSRSKESSHEPSRYNGVPETNGENVQLSDILSKLS